MRNLPLARLFAACSLVLAPCHAADKTPPINPGNFDSKTKPGVDFYRYANGGWMDKNPIPAEYSRWGAFDELTERNNAILHEILDEAAAGKAAKGSAAQKIGDFYASGMDEAAVNEAGIKPLQGELNAIAAIGKYSDLPVAIARLHQLGLGGLFRFDVDQDEKNSLNQIVQIGQGGLGLPDRDYYFKDDARSKDLRAKYEAHLKAMFALLGELPEKADASAASVMKFETELAKVSKTRVALRDPEGNYHKMPLAQLDQIGAGFAWSGYFLALGAGQPVEIDVRQPEFVTHVGELASEKGLPLDDWKTYLRWHLIHSAAADLSAPFVEEDFRFYGQTLTGAKELRPRWKRILKETNGALGEALGQLYVEKTFTADSKQRCLTMVEDLRTVLGERIRQLDWMGAETKVAALKKLVAFTVKIGYPDKWRDYSKLEITRGSHVINILRSNAFEMGRALAKIGQPIDKTEWHMTPPTVNAYYSPNRNEIVFPAGILQPPFFDAAADDAVNYGGIGAVIGHEMTHGFDDQGRQYDADGNLKNWWTDEDMKRFKERSEAIVKQFDDYVAIDDQHVTGSLTQGENIADLGGLKIAYNALEKALARKPAEEREQKIDGFTPQQRLFLSWAQVWRNNIRPEALRLRLNTDPHSPGQFRANGPLGNLPEFQAAFGIPAGSPMLRPGNQQVQIW